MRRSRSLRSNQGTIILFRRRRARRRRVQNVVSVNCSEGERAILCILGQEKAAVVDGGVESAIRTEEGVERKGLVSAMQEGYCEVPKPVS